jgi:hypothetical protein
VHQTLRSWAVLWVGFNDYGKDMYITVEVSKKWDDVYKNQECPQSQAGDLRGDVCIKTQI